MVSTRKRTAAAAEDHAQMDSAKRSKIGISPPAQASPCSPALAVGSPPPSVAKPRSKSVPKKGSRGRAYLAAANVMTPAAPPASAAPPKLSTKKTSTLKAARMAAQQAAAPASVLKSAGAKRNPLLKQALPPKLSGLLDMFAGLQTVHEVMRKRGQRTTFQNMKAAVEEASGRRFLLTHVAQLRQLLPETLDVEWVRLPVPRAHSTHSTRTEQHLLISLDMPAAAEAAQEEGAVAPGGGPGDLQAARQLLHCRLAQHLLDSYRGHLAVRATELAAAGDEEAAGLVEEAKEAAADPPVMRFMAPYPEEVADVQQHAMPARPEVPSRGGSPAVLAASLAAVQAAVPLTPATDMPAAGTTTGRTGRPPVHPSTIDRRLKQRRLSFTAAAEAAATGAGLAPGYGLASKPRSGVSPLTKPTIRSAQQQQADKDGQQQQQQGGDNGSDSSAAAAAAGMVGELHPRQRELAASLAPADLAFGGSIPSEPEWEQAQQVQQAQQRKVEDEEARLLAGMPEELRRFSTDGIISMDTLRKLEAADQQHRRLSSKEAQAARQVSAALGQLPRTFSRLQRIFGSQGPNALKLRDVVLRIKQGGAETTSAADIESQLRAMAQHAPEYLSVRPYGSCGTPALWVNRRVNANELMAKLRALADGRLAGRDSMDSALGVVGA